MLHVLTKLTNSPSPIGWLAKSCIWTVPECMKPRSKFAVRNLERLCGVLLGNPATICIASLIFWRLNWLSGKKSKFLPASLPAYAIGMADAAAAIAAAEEASCGG